MCILCEVASQGANEVVQAVEPVVKVVEPVSGETSYGLGEAVIEQGSQSALAYTGSILGIIQGFAFVLLAVVSVGTIFVVAHHLLESKKK